MDPDVADSNFPLLGLPVVSGVMLDGWVWAVLLPLYDNVGSGEAAGLAAVWTMRNSHCRLPASSKLEFFPFFVGSIPLLFFAFGTRSFPFSFFFLIIAPIVFFAARPLFLREF